MCKKLTQQFKMPNTVDLMTISKLENKNKMNLTLVATSKWINL